MKSLKPFYSFLVIFVLFFHGCTDREESKVLVFTKTAGFEHGSITAGAEAIMELGRGNGFRVDTTNNASKFTEDTLKLYDAVIFLNTTGDVLDYRQQIEFERFIQAGGGFMGIHAASDTEYDWPWYGKLVGGYFSSHPEVQEATIDVIDNDHPSMSHLSETWERTDEWYNFRSLNPDIKVLATLDEDS